MEHELPIESFDVDLTHVHEVVAAVTGRLDEMIERCNADPDYARPGVQSRFPPIRKEGNWPDFCGGAYSWGFFFQPGRGILISGTFSAYAPNIVYYFPDPKGAVEKLYRMERVKENWLANNPNVDLSTDLFSTSKIASKESVVSNDYEDVFRIISERFTLLKRSRTEDIGEF